MPLVVERLRHDDIGQWLDLLEAVAQERDGIATEPPVNRDERRRMLEERLDDENAALLVAWLDERFAGTLAAELRHGIVSMGMLVARDLRGRGIGQALVSALLDWARTTAAHKVTLEVWPHNAAALALYRNAGFVEEGRLRRHYRRANGELWDSIPMGLVLDEASAGRPAPTDPPGG